MSKSHITLSVLGAVVVTLGLLAGVITLMDGFVPLFIRFAERHPVALQGLTFAFILSAVALLISIGRNRRTDRT